jgi:hypothetical protein
MHKIGFCLIDSAEIQAYFNTLSNSFNRLALILLVLDTSFFFSSTTKNTSIFLTKKRDFRLVPELSCVSCNKNLMESKFENSAFMTAYIHLILVSYLCGEVAGLHDCV